MEKKSLNAIEKRDLIIEAGISAIPYIGGSLAALYFGGKQEKRFKRIESFYKKLKEEFNQHKDGILDIENLKKDEVASLIEEINEGIENDHLTAKIEYFKNCFFNTLKEDLDDEKYRKRKYFIYVLSQMNEVDIFYLNKLNKLEEDSAYQMSGEIKHSEHDTSFEKLKAWGLAFSFLVTSLRIGENWGSMSGYKISNMGRDFCSFCMDSKTLGND